MPQFTDPHPATRFFVEIDGIIRASFRECTGFDSTVEVVEYREGGDPTTMHKLPGMTSYANIQLKWGSADDRQLYDWHVGAINGKLERKNGSIVLIGRDGSEVARWNFVDAWPTKWIGPSLNAQSDELAIETLELAHQGLTRA